MVNALQFTSVIVEVLVTVLCVLLATSKGKFYGWLLALTFAIYVVYDSVTFLGLSVPKDIMQQIFLTASVSALIAVWLIFRDARGRDTIVYSD